MTFFWKAMTIHPEIYLENVSLYHVSMIKGHHLPLNRLQQRPEDVFAVAHPSSMKTAVLAADFAQPDVNLTPFI